MNHHGRSDVMSLTLTDKPSDHVFLGQPLFAKLPGPDFKPVILAPEPEYSTIVTAVVPTLVIVILALVMGIVYLKIS